MSLYLGLLLFSFILTSLSLIPFINFLYRVKLTHRTDTSGLTREDTSASRLLHRLHSWKSGTPVGGGLLIIIATGVLFTVIFSAISHAGVLTTSIFPIRDELNIIFFTFISFALLGLFDDISKIFPTSSLPTIRQRTKFFFLAVLSAVVASLLHFNLSLSSLNLPLFGPLDLGWGYLPLSATIIFLFSSGYDFTDGLDGLAAGVLFVGLFAFWVVSATALDTVLSTFISIWLGAVLAFLYFNIYPARIWLGNAGSLSFGATLAVIGLMLGKVIALMIIGSFFLIEIGSSLVQYLSLKLVNRRVFPITPIHHWLQVAGWPEHKITMRSWLLTIMLSVLGLWLTQI